MNSDGFDDLRELKAIQAKIEQKTIEATAKRNKAKETGTAKDFQEAMLADIELINIKLDR